MTSYLAKSCGVGRGSRLSSQDSNLCCQLQSRHRAKGALGVPGSGMRRVGANIPTLLPQMKGGIVVAPSPKEGSNANATGLQEACEGTALAFGVLSKLRCNTESKGLKQGSIFLRSRTVARRGDCIDL